MIKDNLRSRITVNDFKRHATSHPWIGGSGDKHVEHPVCEKCEKIALRDKGWASNRMARCPSCGWSGRATTLLKEYIQEELYRR